MNQMKGPAITPLLKFIRPGMIGAEIGVQQALSSVEILKAGVKKLICIDPWKAYPGYDEVDGIPVAQFEAWRKTALENLQHFARKGRVAVIEKTSEQAVEEYDVFEALQLEGRKFDFVFIDGNHSFDYTWRDILLFWPYVKPGGIICGHDYTVSGPHHQVKEAVTAWLDRKTERGMKFEQHGDCWVIQKPKNSTDNFFKPIDMVMFTWDRREYTKMTLDTLLSTNCGLPWNGVNFVVIDHGSTDGTLELLQTFIDENPGVISYFEAAGENRGVANGFQHFRDYYTSPEVFSQTIGKIDNDSIFTDDWLRLLHLCLYDHEDLGIVGAQEGYDTCWSETPPEGYFPAQHVGGRFLAKKAIFHSMPTLQGKGVWGWTQFQYKVTAAGRWKIGWCHPRAVIEHVGDWGEHHEKAITTPEYEAYMKKVRGGQYKK